MNGVTVCLAMQGRPWCSDDLIEIIHVCWHYLASRAFVCFFCVGFVFSSVSILPCLAASELYIPPERVGNEERTIPNDTQ